MQNILNICGERVDRKREVAQAAFLLSRVLERQGGFEECRRNRERATRIHNELRPEDQKVVNTLTSEDIKHLVYYDYF